MACSSLLVLAACSAPAEQPLISRFFAASRLLDKTALHEFSTVIFDPDEEGIVTTFTIRTVSPEERVGDRVTKSVTVSAPVKRPSGEIVDTTLVVVLQRQSSRTEPWLITGVAATPAARPPVPRS